jgi:hypothetical protein
VVPGAGLEPARLAPTDFKSVVYANSTTQALYHAGDHDTAAGLFPALLKCAFFNWACSPELL